MVAVLWCEHLTQLWVYLSCLLQFLESGVHLPLQSQCGVFLQWMVAMITQQVMDFFFSVFHLVHDHSGIALVGGKNYNGIILP